MGLLDLVLNIASTAFDNALSQQEEYQKKTDRTLRKYERQLDEYEGKHPNSEKIKEAREKIEAARNRLEKVNSYRRTDEEIKNDTTGTNRKAEDFQWQTDVYLSTARHTASSESGVYVLFLHGEAMKCGRAVIGVNARMSQYYNLSYDKRAQAGDYWAVNEQNRDEIKVSWQCCPPSKCEELEARLFEKYGKGPWASRAPRTTKNTWELLI